MRVGGKRVYGRKKRERKPEWGSRKRKGGKNITEQVAPPRTIGGEARNPFNRNFDTRREGPVRGVKKRTLGEGGGGVRFRAVRRGGEKEVTAKRGCMGREKGRWGGGGVGGPL